MFPSHVFLKTMFLPKEKISCAYPPPKKKYPLDETDFPPKEKFFHNYPKNYSFLPEKTNFPNEKISNNCQKKNINTETKQNKKSDFPNEKVFYNYQKKQFSKEKITYTCLKSLFFKMIKFLILA